MVLAFEEAESMISSIAYVCTTATNSPTYLRTVQSVRMLYSTSTVLFCNVQLCACTTPEPCNLAFSFLVYVLPATASFP
jgi:hypothetical protein